MNLSTKQLRAFLALRDVRNFTQAAERCHLSQSAFSALIGNLERDAGVRLFDRSTRRVELTPEGEAFAESAALLIADFDKICEDLRDRVDVRGGRVSIAALPSIAAGLLPELLQGFHERHPACSSICSMCCPTNASRSCGAAAPISPSPRSGPT
jgi:DNA-binding transcriptional LysR family regulator